MLKISRKRTAERPVPGSCFEQKVAESAEMTHRMSGRSGTSDGSRDEVALPEGKSWLFRRLKVVIPEVKSNSFVTFTIEEQDQEALLGTLLNPGIIRNNRDLTTVLCRFCSPKARRAGVLRTSRTWVISCL